MVNRINLLLKAKNISARQFAEEIGIQPRGMSHILSGRNNPSLDFVMKVIRRYPEIDINWLMFGKGEMYESHPRMAAYRTAAPTPMATAAPAKSAAVQPPVVKQEAVQGDLFGQPVESGINGTGQTRDAGEKNLEALIPAFNPAIVNRTSAVGATQPLTTAAPDVVARAQQAAEEGSGLMVGSTGSPTSATVAKQERKLIRLLAFYDDHTFVEYRPQ